MMRSSVLQHVALHSIGSEHCYFGMGISLISYNAVHHSIKHGYHIAHR